MIRSCLMLLSIFACVSTTLAEDRSPTAKANGSPVFESQVRPILKTHCFQCHGEEEIRRLEAEIVRDSMLAVTGTIRETRCLPRSPECCRPTIPSASPPSFERTIVGGRAVFRK